MHTAIENEPYRGSVQAQLNGFHLTTYHLDSQERFAILSDAKHYRPGSISLGPAANIALDPKLDSLVYLSPSKKWAHAQSLCHSAYWRVAAA